MDEATLPNLLGRPLTPNETANADLYLDIANEVLESLICTPVAYVEEESRTFDVREGYSTAFIDIFKSVSEVKVDGVVIDESKYSVRQWNKRNANWYNSIVFNDRFDCEQEIEVTSEWGFDEEEMPADLQLVLAGLFDLITKKIKVDPSVQQKRVEDFSITFNSEVDLDSEFYTRYATTLNKYSLCDIPYVASGKVG